MVFNRSFQLRSGHPQQKRGAQRTRFKRPGRNFRPLKGEQLRFDFEAAEIRPAIETFEEAQQLTFPVEPPTEEYLWREFQRLFPEG
jgi:hypothetical protein